MTVFIDKKLEVEITDLQFIDPPLGVVLYYAYLYARKNKLPFVVTSIWSDGKNVKRISQTHRERRAIDISTRGWSVFHCNRMTHFLNKKFGNIWGTRQLHSNDMPRVCVYGDENHLDHFHLQVRRLIKIDFD